MSNELLKHTLINMLKDIKQFDDVLENIFSDSLSDDDNDNVEDDNISIFSQKEVSFKRMVHKNVNETISSYSGGDFKCHFQMERRTLAFIEDLISSDISNVSGRGRPTLDSRKQILVTIWFLSTSDSYKSIAKRFDISKTLLWDSSNRVLKALGKISATSIKWPSVKEMRLSAREFKNKTSFTGVMGCVEGCHIPIKAPTHHPQLYLNRKGFHSIILQAVVDHNECFIDCNAGQPGSVHDSEVFRLSTLGKDLQLAIPPDLHMLGGPAHLISARLLTPFTDNGLLTQQQNKYNYSLANTRSSSVGRALALLKGRFTRLKYLNMLRLDLIPLYVVGCCVLHNVCQNQNDTFDGLLEMDDEEENYEEIPEYPSLTDIQEGLTKRDEILTTF